SAPQRVFDSPVGKYQFRRNLTSCNLPSQSGIEPDGRGSEKGNQTARLTCVEVVRTSRGLPASWSSCSHLEERFPPLRVEAGQTFLIAFPLDAPLKSARGSVASTPHCLAFLTFHGSGAGGQGYSTGAS